MKGGFIGLHPLFSYFVKDYRGRKDTSYSFQNGGLNPPRNGEKTRLNFIFFASYICLPMEEVYAVIDMKSFYASCECAARGLDIFSTPLVVCDPTRTENTIVMSATPYLKSHYGVKNVERMKDLPKIKRMIYAQPRMEYYIKISAKVVDIFLDFVSEEDLHVYSIDESFLHLTPYLDMNRCSAEELVGKIQKRIKEELGLVATAGLGPNMFLAKVCLDREGKKKEPYRAHWHMEDVQTKLWKVALTDVWGISYGIAGRLAKMGIHTLEALAKTDVAHLEKEFGIIGHQLHDLANGIDRTNIREKYVPKERNLSIGQTLPRDYDEKGTELLLLEMCDELCFRLRLSQQKCGAVSLFVRYSASFGGGFSRQGALNIPTSSSEKLYEVILELFHRYYEGGPVRGLGISFSKLSRSSGHQFDLFSSSEDENKAHDLWGAIDEVASMYGKNAVLRASSLTKDSTIKERHEQIGGHRA